MPKTIQRAVAFYWLRLRSREAVSYRPVEDADWESRLADLDSMKWQEKTIGGIRYDAILGKEYRSTCPSRGGGRRGGAAPWRCPLWR